jgi:hypothetical protein
VSFSEEEEKNRPDRRIGFLEQYRPKALCSNKGAWIRWIGGVWLRLASRKSFVREKQPTQYGLERRPGAAFA